MDTFFEQLVAIKKSGKDIALFILIWFIAIILSLALLIFRIPFLSLFSPILVCGILFCAYRLSALLNVEYEYIVTNGILDVDKIINKSSRKRYLSFDLAKASRIEKYNPMLLANVDKKSVTIACTPNAENTYLIVADKESGGANYLVITPDEKMQSAIAKFVPKFISNSAFK